jgi:hypothetical protein
VKQRTAQSPAVFRWVAVLAFWTFLFVVPRALADEPGFRRFADTISPDGAYVLAWGWGEEEEHLEKLKEWPPGGDTAEDSVANYLVDAVRGQVLATIPERDHFLTSNGRWKRFSGLAVGWAEDGQHALAIYEGRWSDEAILWIRPETRSFIDVLGPLEEAYRRFLAKKEAAAHASTGHGQGALSAGAGCAPKFGIHSISPGPLRQFS